MKQHHTSALRIFLFPVEFPISLKPFSNASSMLQAKQGYVIYRVRVKRGGRKRPVSKGIIYGKPKFQGVKHLKNQVGMRNIAEVRTL